MNEFTDLEAELKKLQPRATSPELAARIETALAQEMTSTPTAGVLPRRPQGGFRWFAIGLSAAAAAAVVILAIVSTDQKAPAPQIAATARTSPVAQITPNESASPSLNGSFVPDGLTRVVYNTRDEGLVYPRQASAPVRRVRSHGSETLHWKEPSTGASLRVSYPTEEVRLIPVGLQ